MTRVSIAALRRFAAICGLLVAPGAAAAQLRCDEAGSGSDIQIRKVSFTGNQSFEARELALHVVSTPTDVSERIPTRYKVGIGAAAGGALGAILGKENRLAWGAVGAAAGTAIGYFSGKFVGIERCVRAGVISGDMLNLRAFYNAQGFPDARVDTSTVIDGKSIEITYHVTEGQPSLVDSLALIGFDSVALGALPERFNSRVGQRYSVARLQQDVDSLETRLRNAGYPQGQVNRAITYSVPRYRAVVELIFEPGPLARIGTVTINRNGLAGRTPRVDTAVIRELLRFRQGDVYSERALFESERQFYRVGSFLSAEVAPVESHVLADSLVDVIVNVTEDLSRTSTVDPGYGTLDCLRLRANYSDKAFLNGLNRLDLSGSVSKIGRAPPTNNWTGISDFCRITQGGEEEFDISSQAINYNATIQLTRPVTLRGGLLPSVSAYTERRGGFKAYLRTTKIGGAATVSKNITRSIFWQSSYNIEYGHTEANDVVLCFLFLACDETTREQRTQDKPLAVLGARFSRDRRNSPDSTTRGTFARLDLRTSERWLGSDRSLTFRKGVVDLGWYHRPVGRSVIAARFRAGLVAGGDTNIFNNQTLPPQQERLFAGGETSVRGFPQNELGPLVYVTDDTAKLVTTDPAFRLDSLQTLRMRKIPAGGNAMLVGNLEYRVPVPFIASLQAIFFMDVGSLSTTGATNLLDRASLRWTPGVAFKYFSPIGPIQVNVGYNDYPRANGPVYFDRFESGQVATLLCLSGTDASGQCQSVPAIPRDNRWFKRLTLTVAFPPDF